MVHPNKQAAVDACLEYNIATELLRQRLGVWEECDDSCCQTYIMVQYVDEQGKIQTYSPL